MGQSYDVLRMQDLKSDTEEAYVLNVTKAPKRGTVLLTTVNQMNNQETVSIPATWLPINLCDYGDPAHWSKSDTLRRAVINLGMLEFIPRERARSLLKRPGAKEERERLQIRATQSTSVEQATALATVSRSGEDSISKMNGRINNELEILKWDSANKCVDEATEIGVVNAMRNIECDFTTEDAIYLKHKIQALEHQFTSDSGLDEPVRCKKLRKYTKSLMIRLAENDSEEF